MSYTYKYQRSKKRDVHFEQKFFDDLNFGESFEKKAIQYIKGLGHTAWKSPDRNFDLRVNIEVPLAGTLPYTAECKFCRLATSTGNLALQTWDGNKPSGVNPNGFNPDLWIHGFDDEIVIVKTSILQNLIEMHSSTWGGHLKSIGDKRTNAKGYLIPISVLKNCVGTHWGTVK